MPRRPRTGLWRDREFLKLCGAQAINQVGTQVTLLVTGGWNISLPAPQRPDA
jgi:hypothetical protein